MEPAPPAAAALPLAQGGRAGRGGETGRRGGSAAQSRLRSRSIVPSAEAGEGRAERAWDLPGLGWPPLAGSSSARAAAGAPHAPPRLKCGTTRGGQRGGREKTGLGDSFPPPKPASAKSGTDCTRCGPATLRT